MLNFINQEKSQLGLKDSLWMFNAEFATFYQERYDFVKFNNVNEIEYLNGKGDLIRKETLEIDKEGYYKIKENPFFRGIELINSNEINLVIEVEHMEGDKSLGMKDAKFKLIKLPQTEIEMSQDQLDIIANDSVWEVELPNQKIKRIQLSDWIKDYSNEEIERILKDKSKFSKHKRKHHLIKIANALIFIRQRLGLVDSKVIVSKISKNELILKVENKELILKRVSL